MTKIFESPDGGETVYARPIGGMARELVKRNKSLHDQLMEDKLWGDIRRRAKTHPGLQAELERVIMFYRLLEE